LNSLLKIFAESQSLLSPEFPKNSLLFESSVYEALNEVDIKFRQNLQLFYDKKFAKQNNFFSSLNSISILQSKLLKITPLVQNLSTSFGYQIHFFDTLELINRLPAAYGALCAEIVRRKAFLNTFSNHVYNNIELYGRLSHRENIRRESFMKQISNYLPFPVNGLDGMSPRIHEKNILNTNSDGILPSFSKKDLVELLNLTLTMNSPPSELPRYFSSIPGPSNDTVFLKRHAGKESIEKLQKALLSLLPHIESMDWLLEKEVKQNQSVYAPLNSPLFSSLHESSTGENSTVRKIESVPFSPPVTKQESILDTSQVVFTEKHSFEGSLKVTSQKLSVPLEAKDSLLNVCSLSVNKEEGKGLEMERNNAEIKDLEEISKLKAKVKKLEEELNWFKENRSGLLTKKILSEKNKETVEFSEKETQTENSLSKKIFGHLKKYHDVT
jgi:hypothetical protein